MKFNFLAVIQGGIGPDVWDKEAGIAAVDFIDAAKTANQIAEDWGGNVVSLEQNDVPIDKAPVVKMTVEPLLACLVLGAIQISLRHPGFRQLKSAPKVWNFAEALEKTICTADPKLTFMAAQGWVNTPPIK